MTATVVDAAVICTAAPETPEWYAARRDGITATDLPRILGYSPYGNALSVWHDKTGNLTPEPGGPAARWGHLLEDVIAGAWAEDHDTTVDRIGIVANREHGWRRAALDRLVDDCPHGPSYDCGLEIKNRSAFKAGSWRDDTPDDVLAQIAWQRIVTGLDHIHVAVLLGGNDLREYTYEPDPDLEGYLIGEATALWQQVQDGTPPEVDASTMFLGLLDRLHPSRSGAREMAREDYAALKADYDRAAGLAKIADGGKDWAAYRLITALGGADHLTAADDAAIELATYRPRKGPAKVDFDRLKREFPDAHKACVAQTVTKPVLTWKKPT